MCLLQYCLHIFLCVEFVYLAFFFSLNGSFLCLNPSLKNWHRIETQSFSKVFFFGDLFVVDVVSDKETQSFSKFFFFFKRQILLKSKTLARRIETVKKNKDAAYSRNIYQSKAKPPKTKVWHWNQAMNTKVQSHDSFPNSA